MQDDSHIIDGMGAAHPWTGGALDGVHDLGYSGCNRMWPAPYRGEGFPPQMGSSRAAPSSVFRETLMPFKVRPLVKDDEDWVRQCLETRWGSYRVVSRGRVHWAHALPGFVAEKAGERVGLVTYHIEDNACEIVTLDSFVQGRGVGSELLEAVKNTALEMGCTRLWLITTNDNIAALHFYQKRGFSLSAIHHDAVVDARKLKPEIPLTGYDGIPIRDEIELAMLLSQGRPRTTNSGRLQP